MRFVCLWSPGWSTGGVRGAERATPSRSSRSASGGLPGATGATEGLEARLAEVLPAVLAEVAPRLRVESGRVWVDGRGLPPEELASALLRALASVGVEDARAGLADAPVVAWAACSPWVAMAGEGPWRRAADGEIAGGRDSGNPAAASCRTASDADAAAGSPAASDARVPPSRHPAIPPSQLDAPVAASPCPRVAVSAGVAHTPTRPHAHTVVVPPGQERAFLAPLPLAVLHAEGADPHVLELLSGVGVETCGALAALEREGVEVRFGAEGLRLWRLARGDDPRLLFQAVPPERPQASLDFVDYVVTDPERLAFTVNALLGSICDGLRERGEHARRLLLVLDLAGGGRWEQGLRPGRATASRVVWLRLARMALDRTTLPDAVCGVRLEVEATEPAAVRQGDLFDAGFATAPAVEAVVLRLLESQGEVVVRPEVGGHPLAERRVRWAPVGVDEIVDATAPGTRALSGDGEMAGSRDREIPATSISRRSWAAGLPKQHRNPAVPVPPSRDPAIPLSAVVPVPPSRDPAIPPSAVVPVPPSRDPAIPPSAVVPVPPSRDPAIPLSAGVAEESPAAALTLQLLEEPREIRVETELRRDHGVPVRYHERGAGWQQVASVAGPDRVSGGMWEDAYAREYFRVVTGDGLLVWLFRDARRGTWYLHGWWD